MNIALVHYTAAPVVGGVERVMEEHARLFVENGHRVTVICQRGGGDTAVRLPGGATSESLAKSLRAALEGQDVVMLHNVLTMPFDLALTEALRRMIDELPRVRFVAWVHDVAACNPDYAPAAPILSKAHSRCEYIAVSALRARQFAEATGTAVADCAVIPNGVEPVRVLGLPDSVAGLAQRRGWLDGWLLLLHPTRLVRRKNVEMSIAIARELHRRKVPVMLLITAADDPHNAAALALRDALRGECDPEFCAMLGSGGMTIGDAELAALFRLSDALILPSRSEGFGLPLLEAALHRLPVFCSDIEPLRGLLHERAVYFSPDAAPAEVASLIQQTLTAMPDFRERKRVLREYGWRAVFERHLASLLAGR